MIFWVNFEDFLGILSDFGGCGYFGVLRTKLLAKMG
jgi:hypothetical protein